MPTSKKTKTKPHADGEKPVNLGKHAAECTICSHPERTEIEAQFVSWWA